jgi:very-long-chain (3R)-3-hydroxyacyl-CoA dehydratase
MAEILRPFVYWGQSKDSVFIKIDLSEITEGPDVELNEDYLDFKAQGTGARGKNMYGFHLDFYLAIDEKLSKYKVTGRAVEFECRKVGVGEVWPRLTESSQKLGWLRPDFDRFTFADSDTSTDDEVERQSKTEKEMLDSLEKELKQTEFSVVHNLKTYYMFMYNMFQWIGYFYIFTTLLYRSVAYGYASHKDAYSVVGPALMVCQLTSVLEILHPLLGWVRSGILPPILQVGGRNVILFLLVAAEPTLQDKEPVGWLFMTWSLVELVRYPYYMLNIINREISFLTWLRYTIWIPLYPTGFILEGIVMLLALPIFQKSKRWCIDLPNVANMSFHFPTMLQLYMVIFIPAMYIMMQRMYQQRKKKIKPSSRPRMTSKKAKKQS